VDKKAYLRHCGDNPNSWDPKDVETIKDKLATAWPSIINNVTNELLWNMQWIQHGTCTDFKVLDYFQKSLDLDAEYPFSKWLTDAQLTPSDTTEYTVDAFKKALDPKLGADNYVLKCAKVKGKSGSDQYWLLDVSVCVEYGETLKKTKCELTKVPEDDVRKVCHDKFYYVDDYTKHLEEA